MFAKQILRQGQKLGKKQKQGQRQRLRPLCGMIRPMGTQQGRNHAPIPALHSASIAAVTFSFGMEQVATPQSVTLSFQSAEAHIHVELRFTLFVRAISIEGRIEGTWGHARITGSLRESREGASTHTIVLLLGEAADCVRRGEQNIRGEGKAKNNLKYAAH
jgi:hypothetical protein